MKMNSIESAHEQAKKRGGRCLSTTYINGYTKLLWECREGHRWEAMPTAVQQGRWCPVCGGSKKSTIEDMQRLAGKRGGKCLSDTYGNARSKLLWECREGHRWGAMPKVIQQNRWCPVCARLKVVPRPLDTAWFKERLDAQPLSLRDISARGGFSASSLSRILRGLNVMNLPAAIELADVLGVSIDEIVYRAGLLPSKTRHPNPDKPGE